MTYNRGIACPTGVWFTIPGLHMILLGSLSYHHTGPKPSTASDSLQDMQTSRHELSLKLKRLSLNRGCADTTFVQVGKFQDEVRWQLQVAYSPAEDYLAHGCFRYNWLVTTYSGS